MRLLWLAEDCLRAGLKVVQISGWEQRGDAFPAIPNTVICHHTATPAKARGDLPTRKILIDGRPDLPGPLCQVALGRNGTVYIVASGKANHAGKGAWKGTTSSLQTIGIEAEHPGVGPWTAPQMSAYRTLVAVLLRGIGQNAERACAHREWALPAGRKTDPNFDMSPFRAAVRAELTRISGQAAVRPTPVPAPTQEDDVTPEQIEQTAQRAAALVREDIKVLLYGTKDGSHWFNLKNIATKLGLKP